MIRSDTPSRCTVIQPSTGTGVRADRDADNAADGRQSTAGIALGAAAAAAFFSTLSTGSPTVAVVAGAVVLACVTVAAMLI